MEKIKIKVCNNNKCHTLMASLGDLDGWSKREKCLLKLQNRKSKQSQRLKYALN